MLVNYIILFNINIMLTSTHFYDRKIPKDLINRLNDVIKTTKNISKDAKLLCFNNLRSELLLYKIVNNTGIEYYDRIILSYQTNKTDNYDSINKMNAIDLLYTIYLISIYNKDVIPILSEQLNDMKTGFCPQGRTIRFTQIIFCFV